VALTHPARSNPAMTPEQGIDLPGIPAQVPVTSTATQTVATLAAIRATPAVLAILAAEATRPLAR
jgi:hypothetical protein